MSACGGCGARAGRAGTGPSRSRSALPAGSVSWCGRGSAACASSPVSAAPGEPPGCPCARPGRSGLPGELGLARGAAGQALCAVSADIINADKMSGRSRKYKIIFSPQKVSGTRGAAHSSVTVSAQPLRLPPLL